MPQFGTVPKILISPSVELLLVEFANSSGEQPRKKEEIYNRKNSGAVSTPGHTGTTVPYMCAVVAGAAAVRPCNAADGQRFLR